ncbi:MAG: efflux RND transporter permease subunit [Deltaproteobacteria bacterium]|nr:efflux RND transporter permease subunit [Deltaproteobacteria bacterium]
MLTRILEASLRHPGLVVAGWAIIAVAGVLSALRLPLDAFPDITPVMVQVNTSAPALSPIDVERLVTAPVEASVSGLPGLKDVRSISKTGFSQVVATFRDGTDVYLARQTVNERVQAVPLPPGIERPSLGPVATGLGEVFHYLVTGEGSSLAEVRSVQDWVVAPQLRSVPGVAEVNSWGGDERQARVLVDPARLQAYGIPLADFVEALERNNRNVGGGVIEEAGEAYVVRGIGIATRLADLENIVVTAREGVPIRVRDLGRVADGREIRRGAVTADGDGEAVLGLGFLLMGENSHDVTSRLVARLEEVRKTLPHNIHVEPVYERTTLVDRVLRTVRTNLLEGALLVVAVLFVFLGNLRAGLVVASAIPLSMLFAANLMARFGIAGSLMSLGAIDFGLLVDSSVIQVENAVRRLGLDRGARPPHEVIRDAVVEVRTPTLFGELIIAIVYLPVLTLEGIEGRLFRPMALTVLFALAGSMLLSLTLVPVLIRLGIGRKVSHREPAIVRGLRRAYRPVLGLALRNPAWVVAGAVLVLANGAFLVTRLGSEFIPRLREGSIVINAVRLASISLDESVRQGELIEKALLEDFPDEVERVWTRTGTAEVATDPMGVELSDVFIMLKEVAGWTRASTQDELVEAMAAALSEMPGMKLVFTQPIEMRANEMIAGVRTDLGVKVFGDDIEFLRSKAREVEAVLKRLPGTADVFTEQVTGQPVIAVEVDRAEAGRHGIPLDEALSAVELLGGIEVGSIQDGQRRFPVAVAVDDRYRRDAAAIGRILVSATSGEQVPLSSVARIHATEGPSTVQREWGKRRVVVQTNVRGRDLGSYVAEAREAIAREVQMPPGTFVRFGGEFENLERASKRLAIVVPVALGLILLLLFATYGRWLDAGRVFTGVPLAAVGGILALWVRELPFSISAGVGFVALAGVSVLGDMVLVSAIRQRMAEGLPLREAVEDAAESRLRPVLMTALVASLGFLPMALNTGFGAEVQRPLATVVIGGVISSTLLTLFVLPVLYTLLPRREPIAAEDPG